MDKDDWIMKLRRVLDYVKDWTDVHGEIDGAFLPQEFMMRDARRCNEEARRWGTCPRSSVDEIRDMMGGRSLMVGTILRRGEREGA